MGKVPANLLALVEELNERGPGLNLALCSVAGKKDWHLEVRRGGAGWPGDEIEKMTKAAKAHNCFLNRIDNHNVAFFGVVISAPDSSEQDAETPGWSDLWVKRPTPVADAENHVVWGPADNETVPHPNEDGEFCRYTPRAD